MSSLKWDKCLVRKVLNQFALIIPISSILSNFIKFKYKFWTQTLIKYTHYINFQRFQTKDMNSGSSSLENNTIQIKSTDVLQLILQYLKQNKFQNSFKTLQQESGITLNQLNQKEFLQEFKAKNWTYVMTQLSQLMLSQQLFFTTYEFICDSLIEKDQFQAVDYIINEIVKPNIKEMAMFRQKIMRLEYIIQHTDQKNLYKNPPSSHRQSSILNQLLSISTEAQPQRLLHLLTQSVKYQVAEGVINPSIKLNLFSGQQQEQKVQTETIIKQVQKTINYTEQSKITALKLSWSEQYLAIGGVDGLIELYNTRDYSLYDNDYQRQGQMFFHDYPVLALEFNYSDQMLASVDSKGLVNVWNLKNGKLLRKIDKETAINAICWGIDPSHILVAYKQTIKLYSVRSCNILKQYKCNNPEFLSTIFVSETHLYCVSTVGTLSIFNYATSQLVSTLETKQNLVTCFRIFTDLTTSHFNKFYLAFRKKLLEFDHIGMQSKQIAVEDGQLQNCIAKGQFLYLCIKGSDSKYRISVMEKSKKKVVFYTSLESNFQQMLISRKRNLLVTYDEKHRLSFWRPA